MLAHLKLLWVFFGAGAEETSSAVYHRGCHGHFRIRILILVYPAGDEYNHVFGPTISFYGRVFSVVCKEAKRFVLLVHTRRRDAHDGNVESCRVACICPEPHQKSQAMEETHRTAGLRTSYSVRKSEQLPVLEEPARFDEQSALCEAHERTQFSITGWHVGRSDHVSRIVR